MDNGTVIWMLATVLAILSLVLLVMAILLRYAMQRQDKVVEVIQKSASVSQSVQQVGLEPNLLLRQLGGAGKPLRLINLGQHAIHLVNVFVYSTENEDNKKKLTPTDPERISAVSKWLLKSNEFAELRVFSDERFSQLASRQGGDVIAQAIVQVDFLYATKGNRLQSEKYTLSLATERGQDGKLRATIVINPINQVTKSTTSTGYGSDFTDGWTDQV